MKLLATKHSDQNKAILDPWSAIHMTTGLAFGLIGVNFTHSMIAAILYDVAENGFERTKAGQKFFKTSGSEHPANIAADLVLFALGWSAGAKYIGKK